MMRPLQRDVPQAADPFAAGFEQLLYAEYEKTFKATVQVLTALDAMLEAMWEFDRGMIHEKYRAVVERLERG